MITEAIENLIGEVLDGLRSYNLLLLTLSPILLPLIALYYSLRILLESIITVLAMCTLAFSLLLMLTIIHPLGRLVELILSLVNIDAPDYFSQLGDSCFVLFNALLIASSLFLLLSSAPVIMVAIDFALAAGLAVYFHPGPQLSRAYTPFIIALAIIYTPYTIISDHPLLRRAQEPNVATDMQPTDDPFNGTSEEVMIRLRQDELLTALLIGEAIRPEHALLNDAEMAQLRAQAHSSAEITSLLENYDKLSKPQCPISLEEGTLDGSDAGIIVEKQYEQNNRYHAVPGYSHFYNKTSFEHILTNNPATPQCPISRDPFLRPSSYNNCHTRYVWYPFSHRLDNGQVIILQREYHQVVAQLRQHLNLNPSTIPFAPTVVPETISPPSSTSESPSSTTVPYGWYMPSTEDVTGLPVAKALAPISITTATPQDPSVPVAEVITYIEFGLEEAIQNSLAAPVAPGDTTDDNTSTPPNAGLLFYQHHNNELFFFQQTDSNERRQERNATVVQPGSLDNNPDQALQDLAIAVQNLEQQTNALFRYMPPDSDEDLSDEDLSLEHMITVQNTLEQQVNAILRNM